ncbi:protein kinase domain-containing protein [Sorangium sp. So ce131]|uniref:serine/threonine-protein kinase n=1 Tax=Sorangium sp. So ce131 TaxID=3133282 RepID=UPI003F617F36
MKVGDLVDARYELVERAAEGGMGAIFRAEDRTTGQRVALKLMGDPEGGNADRFAHEAQILAGIQHPNIVRYLGHGKGPTGEPYLAMEWLEGEDLDARLARGPLALEEGLDLIRRVADALRAAHARRIVHRDIKPRNLFLVGGDASRVKVLDFGIARRTGGRTKLTRTGAILGTPGYMAPEQVRGDEDIGPPADVFALGAVLFECLTGQPAFQGEHFMALLAKLLLEDPPRLSEVRTGIPRGVSDLCARMLMKDPEARLRDGAAVLEALAAVAAGDEVSGASASERDGPASLLGTTERRLVSAVFLKPPPGTLASADRPARGPDDPTLAVGDAPRDALGTVRGAVEPLGARADALMDGTILAVLWGTGSAQDQAAQAARCALRVSAVLPGAEVVLVTGRSEVTRRLQVGELVERAAAMLEHKRAQDGQLAHVAIDDVTHALLDPRFDVMTEGSRAVLRTERLIGEEPRTLLGKPSPFVGRDREVRRLLDLLEDAFEERSPRAILVTAPPGAGKSRLRQELLRRLWARFPDVGFTVVRADAMGRGTPFSLIGTGLRIALGIHAGEPIEAQRETISSAVSMFLQGERAERVAEFLGEIAGAPFPDEKSPQLRAARQDARLMAAQVESSCIDLARAVARVRPAVLVLEDLHWGDAASVKLCNAMLREIRDERLAIIAFARPEVHECFPGLWEGRDVHGVRLGPLPRRAAEQMVRQVLGPTVDAAQVDAIVERAGGHAFYLEELTRAVAETGTETLPETVLGMVEARLASLPSEARRLLRAASIFGERFWRNGVAALVGDERAMAVDELLADLVQRELVAPRSERRFAGEDEYTFRHALVREGAYAMLTERDRQLGHGLAGAWLERAGEPEPAVLAEHFERGGERARAAHCHARAARRALMANELTAALAAVDRGIAAGAEGELAAELWATRTTAEHMTGNHALACSAALETMRRAAPGSLNHCRGLGSMIRSALFLGRFEMVSPAMGELLAIEPTNETRGELVWAMQSVMLALLLGGGLRDMAAPILERLRAIAPAAAEEDPMSAAEMHSSYAVWELFVNRNPEAASLRYQAAERLMEIAGNRFNQGFAAGERVLALAMLGAFEEAEVRLPHAVELAAKDSVCMTVCRFVRSYLHVEQGMLAEAVAEAQGALDAEQDREQSLMSRALQNVLAEALLLSGELDASESAIVAAGAGVAGFHAFDAWTRGIRARVLLARGQIAGSVRESEEVIALCRSTGVYPLRHEATLLTWAEALHAAGELAAAERAIREARDDLLARAACIEDPAYRESFLTRSPANARTLALAAVWLDGRGSAEARPGDPARFGEAASAARR